jgi:hypothetical protein
VLVHTDPPAKASAADGNDNKMLVEFPTLRLADGGKGFHSSTLQVNLSRS